MSAKVQRLAADDGETVHAIAALYCQVWRESPWNEEFWTVEGVVADVGGEMRKSGASCFYVADANGVTGFTWGYTVSAEDLLLISGSEALGASLPEAHYFYIDELAVRRDSREHGIGRSLTEALVVSAVEGGATLILLRTDRKAAAARALYERLGFQELSAYDSKYPERTYWMKQVE